MRSPTHVVAVMIRTALSACILAAACNLAVAGPVARTTNAVATAAPDALPAAPPRLPQGRPRARFGMLLIGLASCAVCSPDPHR